MTVADDTFLNSAAGAPGSANPNAAGSLTGGGGLVHGSIVLFSTALGIGLFRHGGLALASASAVAVVTAATLTLAEMTLRRSGATRAEMRRLAEANERLERLTGATGSAPARAEPAADLPVMEAEARDQTAARRERDAFDDSDIAEALAPLAEQVDLIEAVAAPPKPLLPRMPVATLPAYSSLPELAEPVVEKAAEANPAAASRTYRPAPRAAATRNGDPELTAIIERAINDGETELHLQPIARLSDRKARFYEVFPRLRGVNGETLAPAEFMPAARFAGLALPLEQAILSKGLELLERLSGRGKAKPLFVAMSRTAVADERMRADVLDLLQRYPALVEYLILEFEEGDLFQFGPAENASLDAFTAAGLVFAMTKPTTLEFDLDWLRDRKFAFIKVPANLLIEEGENTTGLGQRLGQSGLQLVIEQIADEVSFAHAHSIGAVLGQGSLFSDPRPVRPELLAGGGA